MGYIIRSNMNSEKLLIPQKHAEGLLEKAVESLEGITFRNFVINIEEYNPIQKEVAFRAMQIAKERYVAKKGYPERAILAAGPWVMGQEMAKEVLEIASRSMIFELESWKLLVD